MNKPIVVIVTSPPYSSAQFREALDLVLAFCTFDREAAFVLEADATYACLPDQLNQEINQKSITKMMKALPIYGIEDVLVCKEDALKRNIDIENSQFSATPISKADISELIQNASSVFRF